MRRTIVLWSTPRSVSTAFDKMMRGRGDHRVFTEPFSVPFYFGPDRGSTRFAAGEYPPATYHEVWADIEAADTVGPVFVKAMAHHLGRTLGPAALAQVTNTFLIRDPAWAVPSFLAKWPDVTDVELGYEAQHRAFDLAMELSDGEAPVVIDSDSLRADPEVVIERWCSALGIEHRSEWLNWDPGAPADWALWAEWFDRAAASSSFAPPDDRPPPEVDVGTAQRIERCRAHYDALRRHCL